MKKWIDSYWSKQTVWNKALGIFCYWWMMFWGCCLAVMLVIEWVL